MKEEFRDDRMFPSMLWYGIEPAVPLDMVEAIELARLSRIPLFSENIARRIALEIEKRPEALNQLLVSAGSESFRHPERVVAGVAKALQGWQKATAPRNWESFVRMMTANNAKVSSDVERDMQSLRLVFGDGRAAEELMKVIEDSAADPETRRQALRSLLTSRTSNDAQSLFKFLGDRILAREAIRGLAFYDHADTPKQILNRIKSFGPGERVEMINTLASRGPFAIALMRAIREKKIEPHEVSAFHARQIRSFENDALNRELAELWGDVRITTADKRQTMDELRVSMDADALAKSDLRDGRAVFQKNCANCHVLFGAGTKVGPDLTGSNRKNIDYLLENIVDPSASVGAEFRTSMVLLEDGRAVNGVVVAETERTITLQTLQERVTLDRNEIDTIKKSTTSLMPDGLLQNLSKEQVRNLFAYLMADAQVALPE